jgi:hypothetical protein
LLLYPGIESIAGHAIRPHTDLKATFPQMRLYTFLRDPRARTVSAFLFTRAIRISEERWRPASDREIEDEFIKSMMRPRNDYCAIFAPGCRDPASAIEALETKMDFVGLVEHFDESLALFRNWIGRPDFDPTYRRMNDSERRGTEEPKFRAVHRDLDRLVRVVSSVAARPDVAEMIAAAQPEDIALYDHVRTKTFERMRQRYSAGPGPFSFEDRTSAADTIAGRLYRNIVGRPFVHLIARTGGAVR